MASNVDPIILKIELQEAQAKVNLKKLETQVKSLDGRTKEYKLAVKKLQVEELKLDEIQSKRAAHVKQFAGSTSTLTKQMKGVSKASGGATASVMEMSRAISDAPYGIRGVANNLTQMVSQIGYTAKSAGGLGNAFKLMWKTMMGPLGIVLAITTVITAMDWLYGGAKKAEKGVKGLNDTVGRAGSNLKILKQTLEMGVITQEESNEAVRKANEQYEGLNLVLDDNNKLTDDSIIAINLKIDALGKLAKAQALQKLVEDEYAKLLPLQIAQSDLEIKATEKEARAMRALSMSYKEHGTAVAESGASSARSAADKGKKAITEIQEKIVDLLKMAGEEGLVDELFRGKKGGKKGKDKKSILKDPNEFNKELEDYLSQIEKATEKEELINSTLNSEKAIIQKKYHLERLAVKHTENKEKFKLQSDAYRIEFKAFLKQEVLMKRMTQKEADSRLNDFNTNVSNQRESSNQNYIKLLDKWGEFYDDKYAIALEKEGKIVKKTDEDSKGGLDKVAEYITAYKTLMSGVTEFINGEYDRQSTIEQNKTNAVNEQLNNRLNNENLSKDERASIQNEIRQNDEKLRVAQDAIAKKKFNTAKAFNIAMAVIDTYSAANKALNDPTPMPTPVRWALAGATIASGLAQVAAISRSKFQSSSAATPINSGGGSSGGSGGVGDRDFNFNLVGNTQGNQLAEAIQGQFSQPLQAFVVSHDITTQQELDAEIQGSATF